MTSLDKRLAKLEEQASGGQQFNIVIRWVGQDKQAVGLTRLSDRLTVNRLDGETESQFQDRAAVILGGEQWQVPEFALQNDVTTEFLPAPKNVNVLWPKMP